MFEKYRHRKTELVSQTDTLFPNEALTTASTSMLHFSSRPMRWRNKWMIRVEEWRKLQTNVREATCSKSYVNVIVKRS